MTVGALGGDAAGRICDRPGMQRSPLLAPIRHPAPLALGRTITLSEPMLAALTFREINVSEAFTLVNLFGEQRFGRFRVFIHADNLTDVRQTDWDPIVRPTRDVDGRWTVDAWAPLKGRVINGGLRILF